MSKTQEALKLALEALNSFPHRHLTPFIGNARTTLREALASGASEKSSGTEQPAQQEPVDSTQISKVWWDGEKLMAKPIPFVEFYKPAQRKPLTDWIDPNDKTQKQYLPHIGEPVLFCHNGMTYMGKHTGGSFQSEVTNQYFNTWECHWMYLPAAHGIKE